MRTRTLSLLASMLVAACGAAPSSQTTVAANDSVAPDAATQGEPFTIAEVARFTTPWAIEVLPGTSQALVSEKEGRLWLVDLASGQKQAVAGAPQAHVEGQGGLGEVVAHPAFASNQRVYLSFAEAGPGDTRGAVIGYGQLVTGEGQPRIDGFKAIWRQDPKVSGAGHYSHRIAFAPDGTMFVSSGDRQKMQPAQDPASDLGKILHLTAEGQPVAGGPWASRGGRAASHWTMGHRNVLGLAFAADGRLWAAEMGPQGGDELNLILPGKNYGWPEVSYGSHYGQDDIPDNHREKGFEEPKLWWNPSESPGGLLIYSGDLFRGWKGDALIPMLSGQALVRADLDGETARKADHWEMGQRLRAVEQGPRGEIYLLEDGRRGAGGRLLRLEPTR